MYVHILSDEVYTIIIITNKNNNDNTYIYLNQHVTCVYWDQEKDAWSSISITGSCYGDLHSTLRGYPLLTGIVDSRNGLRESRYAYIEMVF